MKYSVFFSALLLTILAIAACRKHHYGEIAYDGIVLNAQGKPNSGTTVTLKACNNTIFANSKCEGHRYTIGETETDASGKFHINVTAVKSDDYYISLGKDNDYKDVNHVGISGNFLSASTFTRLSFQ